MIRSWPSPPWCGDCRYRCAGSSGTSPTLTAFWSGWTCVRRPDRRDCIMIGESSGRTLLAEPEDIRTRLAEAEETLRAIRDGEADALVIASDRGEKIQI